MAKNKKRKRKQPPKGINQNQKAKSSPKAKPSSQAKPRQKRKRHRRHRNLARVLLLLLILVTGVILSLTFFFKIEDIVVVGVEHYEPQEIIDATGIEIEDNLFLIDTKKIEANLLRSFPYLEEVSVVQAFPPSIEIRIVPSVAVAALEQSAHNYVLITYQGKILEQGLSLPSWDALLVHGVPIKGMEAGDVLGQWSPEPKGQNESSEETAARKERDVLREEVAEDQKGVLRMLRYLSEAMEDADFDAITNVDLSDRYIMKVRYENRLVLELGSETDLSYKLKYLQEILEHHLHPDAPGILNLAEIRKKRVYYKYPEGYRKDGTRLEDPPFTPDENYIPPQTEEDIDLEASPTDDKEWEGLAPEGGLTVEPPATDTSTSAAASSVVLSSVDPTQAADEIPPDSPKEPDNSSEQTTIPLESVD